MSAPIKQTIQRVLVSFGNSWPSDMTLEIAASLAATLRAELSGLFVEDENLLRLASLPFACEIGSTTAATRAMNVDSLARSLRAKADEAKRSLEASAQRVQVQWSFQTRRGQVHETTLAAAAEADVTILNSTLRLPGTFGTRSAEVTSRGVRLSRLTEGHRAELHRTHAPVLVIVDGSDGALRALHLGLRIVQSNGMPLHVIVVGDSETPCDLLLRQARQVVAEHRKAPTHFEQVHSVDELLERASTLRKHFRLVLFSQGSKLATDPYLAKFLARLESPVALVRGEEL